MNLEDLHAKCVNDLRDHFMKNHSPVFGAVRQAYNGISVLRLSDPDHRAPRRTMESRMKEWSARPCMADIQAT